MNQSISTLLSLEAREDLWNRRVLGYPVWAHLRLGCYHRLLGHAGPAIGGEAGRQRILERAPASARDVLTRLAPALRRRDIWVLSSSRYRRTEPSGATHCVFAKDLVEQFGSRLLFLETNPANAARAHEDNVVFLDCLRDAARVACARSARLLPATPAAPFTTPAEISLAPHRVLSEALFGGAWRQFARALLSLGKPKAVFVLCAYDHHVPFQFAAREHGVPIIELQHGVIHESHPGYVFGDDFAADHAPDHLLAFGAHYSELLSHHCRYWRGRTSNAGHTWLKAKREQYARREPEELVVVFGQNVPAVQARVRQCALGLRALIPRSARIVLKPHPAERNSDAAYQGLAEAGIEIADRQSDSYDLLGRCRVAVSVFSTIAIEALAFPCRSVALRSPDWFDDLRHFVDSGFIQAAEGADDVAAAFHGAAHSARGDMARALFGVGDMSLDLERIVERLIEDKQRLGRAGA